MHTPSFTTSRRPGALYNESMSLREVTIAVLGAVVLVLIVMGGMFALLIYDGDMSALFRMGESNTTCDEESGDGVCSVKRLFFRSEVNLDQNAKINL